MTRRTKQGGSAVIFIVIGVVLAISLIGSVYLIKQRGEFVRKEQAIESLEKDKETTTDEEDRVIPSNEVVEGDKVEAEGDEQPVIAVTDLPVTGSESVVGSSFVVFIISTAIFYYLSSKRNSKVVL